jgi:four helix bundle protein
MSRESGIGNGESKSAGHRSVSRESGMGNGESKRLMVRPFHENLDAFQLARQLVIDLYRDTASFPSAERFGLTSQFRRAALSIPANIAEGAARSSKKEFSQFLSIARGSATELHLLLDIACETGRLSADRFAAHSNTIGRIVAMTNGLMRRAKAFSTGSS